MAFFAMFSQILVWPVMSMHQTSVRWTEWDQLIEKQKIDLILLLIIVCVRVLANKKIRYLVASVSTGDQSLPKSCCPSHKTSQSVYCSLFRLCVCISLDDDDGDNNDEEENDDAEV